MHNIKRMLVTLSILLFTGCGGGSGSGSGNTIVPTTTVNGIASKGLITNGTVTIFAINANGSKGTQLGTGPTDSKGAYSISLGTYTGPIIVEAYGSYLDEATGQTRFVPASVPLRAALADSIGTVSLPVTPLTDLAVRQAGTLTTQNITAANALLSKIFDFNIITTVPAAPTTAAFQTSTTTQAQKDYSLILAAVSQQMQTSGSDLAATLASVNSGIASTGINAQTAATLTTAVSSFIVNPNNKTSVTTITGSSLQAIGSTQLQLYLTLQGTTASLVKAIQATITLPAGVSIRADETGKVVTTSLAATGNALGSSVGGNYMPATANNPATLTLGLISPANLTSGDVIVLNVDIAPGSNSPSASAFNISASKLVATGGMSVDGAFLVLR